MANIKKKKISRLDKLGQDLTAINGDIDTLNRKDRAKRHRKKRAHQATVRVMVPKPKGRAGRHDGYSIKDAMGLTDQSRQYNVLCDLIRKLVVRYLDTTVSLSRQKDRLLVEKVIVKAQSDAPFLMRFEGGWATRAIMAQYLRNRSLREQKLRDEIKDVGSKMTTGAQVKKRNEEDKKPKGRVIRKSRLERTTTNSRSKRVRDGIVDDETTTDNSDVDDNSDDDTEMDLGDSEMETEMETDWEMLDETEGNSEGEMVSEPDSESGLKDVATHIIKSGQKTKRTQDDDESEDETSNPRVVRTHITDTAQVSKKRRLDPKASGHDGHVNPHPSRSSFVNQSSKKGRDSAGKARDPKAQDRHMKAQSLYVAQSSKKGRDSAEKARDHKAEDRHVKAQSSYVDQSSKKGRDSAGKARDPKAEDRHVKAQSSSLKKGKDSENAHDLNPKDARENTSIGPLAERIDHGEPDSEKDHIDGLTTSEDELDSTNTLIRCPGLSCKDRIPPSNIWSTELTAAVKSYLAVRQRLGRSAGSTLRIGNEVCMLTRKNKARMEKLQEGLEHGWPVTSIDFKGIPKRITVMFNELQELLNNPTYREASCVWGSFEGDLELDHLTVERFVTIKPSKILPSSYTARGARVGYYGPRGASIIHHTLLGLFPVNNTPDVGFKPLTHAQLFQYFLVPYVAAALIAQDLNNTTLDNGHRCMTVSSDLGDLQYPVIDSLDDEELDEIYQTNMILFKRIGQTSMSAKPLMQVVPTEEDVDDAANLWLRLKRGPDPGQTRPPPRIFRRDRVDDPQTQIDGTPGVVPGGPGERNCTPATGLGDATRIDQIGTPYSAPQIDRRHQPSNPSAEAGPSRLPIVTSREENHHDRITDGHSIIPMQQNVDGDAKTGTRNAKHGKRRGETKSGNGRPLKAHNTRSKKPVSQTRTLEDEL